MAETKRGKKLIKRLKVRYRLVIMTENSFEEKFAFSLTPMNVFVALSTGIVLFAAIVISLIVLTPVREYIPGYSDTRTRRNVEKLILRADSLESNLKQRDRFIETLKSIIDGKAIPADSLRNLSDSSMKKIGMMIDEKLKQQHQQEAFSNQESGSSMAGFYFFPPVKGLVSRNFNQDEDHLALDLVTQPDAPVKATLPGTVIFSSWTPETGHVIGLQHANNLVSIYKHNSALLKKTGALVSAGDAIAIVGNSGEASTGPHLHFELWYNGNPVNPEEYMAF